MSVCVSLSHMAQEIIREKELRENAILIEIANEEKDARIEELEKAMVCCARVFVCVCVCVCVCVVSCLRERGTTGGRTYVCAC